MFKKMIGCLIAAVVLAAPSVTAFAAYTPYMFTGTCVKDESGNKITDLSECKRADFTAYVNKNTVSDRNAKIYAALYRDNVLLKVTVSDAKTVIENNGEFAVSFFLPYNRDNLNIKAFIWDATTLEPLSKVYNLKDESRVPEINLDDGAIIVEGNDFYSLMSAITQKVNAGGGTVYIKSNLIDCYEQIRLDSSPKERVKIEAYPGYTPVLDFSIFIEDPTAADGGAGIYIGGSNYCFKGVIIEKAPIKGVLVKGTGANDNLFENCVFRYNKNSGIHISSSAARNILKNCYSYRNCDFFNQYMGQDADGFSIKLSAFYNGFIHKPEDTNKAINCFSWENSDDGFDSYDWYEDMYYENCIAWHSGDVNVFTGKYDFLRGRAPDVNMPLLKLLIDDENFKTVLESQSGNESDFDNALPVDMQIPVKTGYGATRTLARALPTWRGSSNGFKFASASVTSLDTVRIVKNCVAFDEVYPNSPTVDGVLIKINENGKGFDKNNGTFTINLDNTVAFSNRANYELDTQDITSFNNVVSFLGTNPFNVSYLKGENYFPSTSPSYDSRLKQLSSEAEEFAYENEVRSMTNYIENSVRANMIPDEIKLSFWD